MDILGGFMIVIVIGCIAIGIQYWIVWRAIHDSDLAQDIKAIKEMLQKLQVAGTQPPGPMPHFDNQLHDTCPGCGSTVLITDRMCKFCGLRLLSEDEEKE